LNFGRYHQEDSKILKPPCDFTRNKRLVQKIYSVEICHRMLHKILIIFPCGLIVQPVTIRSLISVNLAFGAQSDRFGLLSIRKFLLLKLDKYGGVMGQNAINFGKLQSYNFNLCLIIRQKYLFPLHSEVHCISKMVL
jgi:hypothetical protein